MVPIIEQGLVKSNLSLLRIEKIDEDSKFQKQTLFNYSTKYFFIIKHRTHKILTI